jgi:hypothetical protein
LPSPLVMTDEELYLFDLHGYLVVPQVLSQDTVAVLNQHIDANLERVHTRDIDAGSLDGRDEPIHGGVAAPAMAGTHGRGDFGGFLWDWGEPAGAVFRSLIANQHVMRIVIGVIGDAFRLAGANGLSQSKGAEGFVLHGGGNPDNMFAVCTSVPVLSVARSPCVCIPPQGAESRPVTPGHARTRLPQMGSYSVRWPDAEWSCTSRVCALGCPQ